VVSSGFHVYNNYVAFAEAFLKYKHKNLKLYKIIAVSTLQVNFTRVVENEDGASRQ